MLIEQSQHARRMTNIADIHSLPRRPQQDFGRAARRGGKLSIDEARPIIMQALDGLHYAHHAEIPHVKLKDGSERLVQAGITKTAAISIAAMNISRAAAKTTARLDDGAWVLDGSKAFITNSGTPITGVHIVTGVGTVKGSLYSY